MEQNEELEALRTKRINLLVELVKTDAAIRGIVGRPLGNSEHKCSCEQSFGTYFERQVHIDILANPDHRILGEQKHYFKCQRCQKQFVDEKSIDNHNCIPITPRVQAKFGQSLDLDNL